MNCKAILSNVNDYPSAKWEWKKGPKNVKCHREKL